MDSTRAKQFLILKVIEQTALEHIPLSDVETKMLYFTEVHSSLPNIHEVNSEFERDYNADEYEDKISGLLKNARDRDARSSLGLAREWKDAINALKDEDHYILVLLYSAFPSDRRILLPTHRVRDYVIYIAVGITLVVVVACIAMWGH
jgi:hypothetical protein